MEKPTFTLTPEVLDLVTETAAQVGVLKTLKKDDDFSLECDDFNDSTPLMLYMLRSLHDAVCTEVERVLALQMDGRVKQAIEEKVKYNIKNKRENKQFSTEVQKVENNAYQIVENNGLFGIPQSLHLSKSEQRVIALIQGDCRITIGSISRQAQLSEAGVNKILSSLRHKGVLERVGANKNGYWCLKLV